MRVTTRTVAATFLRLGILGFGGPAAHIALMHEDIVRKRRWLTEAQFADLLAATNLIPGPNSTEMALHIGRRVAGWPGFAMAGACFILPATVLVGAAAAAYIQYGRTPDFRAAMAGIFPVIIAVIAHAAVQLSRTALRTPLAWALAVGCAALAVYGVNELALLVAGGLLAAVGRRAKGRSLTTALFAIGATAALAAVSASTAVRVTLSSLTLVFLKVGAVLYGSGYVLVALLRADLVEERGWLTDQQLLDAVSVGQMTPGPVFTTATFIGALLAGWPGAAVATVAIFLPAFIYVAATQPLLARVRRSAAAAAFLDGVVAASLGLLAAVTFRLHDTALPDAISWAVALLAFVVLVRWRLNSGWLIAAGAVAGVAFFR